jgi:hypothetical protein
VADPLEIHFRLEGARLTGQLGQANRQAFPAAPAAGSGASRTLLRAALRRPPAPPSVRHRSRPSSRG